MNSETLNLIERPYQEVVDDILTAIAGGVVNEPIVFDLKVDLYPLAEPASEVRKVTGAASLKVDGEVRTYQHHDFQKDIDYIFSEDDDKAYIIWQEGGTWPDDETTFYVDYFRKYSRSPLTDVNVGGVTRTLGEAIGREIATVYQQINRAYLSAFIDTAEGKSLDLVASILGIKRLAKDYARGEATFFRDPAIEGNIAITESTLLKTAKGEATFRTAQLRTLQQGQVRINVPIRASEESKGSAGEVEPGTITKIVLPIAGIGRVTNFDATFLGAEGESDDELRARAKATLRALGKGTLAALKVAIAGNRGATLSEVWDPNGPPAKRSDPGKVTMLVECEPEIFSGLRASVEEVRAAGIQTAIVARYIYFKPRIAVYLTPKLSLAGKEKVLDEIIAALQAYVDDLSSGDPAEGKEMLKAIKDVDDVIEVAIKDVFAWRADVGRPSAETLVDVVMTALQGDLGGDEDDPRKAITAAIAEISPLVPSSRRIADRSLIKVPTGERAATDEEIEAGEFQVVATIDGENWWVVLDMERADILLEEKET